MPYINCLDAAETIQIARDACDEQAVGVNWLTSRFYGNDAAFHQDGRFRFVQFGDRVGTEARYVCSVCEGAPGSVRAESRFVEEFTIPHLKMQDQVNWCDEMPARYAASGLPWRELTEQEKWELFDIEKVEDQLSGHFTSLNIQAGFGLTHGAQRVKWANPNEEDLAAGGNAKYKDIVHGRPDAHQQDLVSGGDWKAWGSGRKIATIHSDIAEMSEMIGDAVTSAVTDIVFGPKTFTQGMRTAEDFRKYFGESQNCCQETVEGTLDTSNVLRFECNLVEFHGNVDGINYWTYRGQYRDADGQMRYYVEPGHMLMVANGANGFQGQRIRGGIDHPMGSQATDGYLLFQGNPSADATMKDQTFYSRDFVYPGRAAATGYFKVIEPKFGGAKGKVKGAA